MIRNLLEWVFKKACWVVDKDGYIGFKLGNYVFINYKDTFLILKAKSHQWRKAYKKELVSLVYSNIMDKEGKYIIKKADYT